MKKKRSPDKWNDSLVVRCDQEWKRRCKVYAKEETDFRTLSGWVRAVLGREMKKENER